MDKSFGKKNPITKWLGRRVQSLDQAMTMWFSKETKNGITQGWINCPKIFPRINKIKMLW